MHYLSEVAKEVNRTHPRLGNLTAMAMLAIKAKKLLLVVAPRGCGKSRVSTYVGLGFPRNIIHDRFSMAALASWGEELTGFDGALVIDDLSKAQTVYSRITTVTTMAELVYSHYCRSDMAEGRYFVQDFYGSAIANIQPVLLKHLVGSDEWEASMMDKSIRYYHLYRPLNPNPLPPGLVLNWGKDMREVQPLLLKGKLANQLMKYGEFQWGVARTKEHTADLLRASAALDSRTEVTQSDYKLLFKVLNPLRVEELVYTKKELEEGRKLDSNLLALLTEFVSYGQFTLRQVARDYGVSALRCYQILDAYHKDWEIVAKNPTTYAPSEELRSRLKEVRLL